MPNFKSYDNNQSSMVVINDQDPSRPDTFEHAIHIWSVREWIDRPFILNTIMIAAFEPLTTRYSFNNYPVAKESLEAIAEIVVQATLSGCAEPSGLKTAIGMEHLTCKTPEINQKEIWIYLFAYNLIRILMAQAASLADILPNQLSFKYTHSCGLLGLTIQILAWSK